MIPNSVLAKRALYESQWNLGFWGSLVYSFALDSFAGIILLALTVIGLFIALGNRPLLGLFAVFILLYLLALAVADTHIFLWYPAPIYPLMFLVSVKGAFGLWEKLPKPVALKPGWLALMAATVVAVSGVIRLDAKAEFLKWETSAYKAIHQRTAEYLVENAGSADLLLAEDIGQLGYIYRGRIVDRDGLVTPQAIPYIKHQALGRFVDSVNADWVFISMNQPNSRAIIGSSEFQSQYDQQLELTAPGANRYGLFRRIE
jgi:hypothetical protein